MKVLVAYASKYGATEGIALRIGETLSARGIEVDVRRCKDLDGASGYDAYIVGSAVYEFSWRKAARKFVEDNAEVLASKPTWLFASGPLGAEEKAKEGNDALTDSAPKQFAKYEELVHPRGTTVFRGAYDHDKVNRGDRFVAWLPGVRDLMDEGDFREWDVIDAWASGIAEELQGADGRT
ncbi:menaquinone-dependent protoporphyrinogen oxidase [Agromyces flavus]|uniref:Menaquinone-dependent protoporphyrinogen oxidase n=1 Tax=Agromyces flavus TaxID=589382 RepID=A0A1H1W078_9MICO|nr:flavodoxin domain-containing protein [Agromyces flavus]MCP2366053.1 menaquinone-dependent protoporphyrinogen oxidase [Agromyces flavus]GGI43905.1 flavodoxin [Agromyces flavus]SDS90395.1 menaquinone-dependent protoporphyrinogen oxidase [Agromyces flavus]